MYTRTHTGNHARKAVPWVRVPRIHKMQSSPSSISVDKLSFSWLQCFACTLIHPITYMDKVDLASVLVLVLVLVSSHLRKVLFKNIRDRTGPLYVSVPT